MLRTVHFHGALRRKFNRASIKLDADSVAEAMRGLSILLPGFTEYVRDRQYAVTAANDRDEMPLDEEALLLNLGKRKHIHVIPAAQAAGIETFLIVGLVLVAVASVATVLFMRPKAPDVASRERKDQSFIYGGPASSIEQGHPVPLIYGGPVRVGGIVVSAGITTTDIGTSSYTSPGGGYGGGYVGSTPGVSDPNGSEDGQGYFVDRPIATAQKGGGKSGGGATRTAEESPNTLRSQATVKIVDLVGEGEIGGLVNGLKSAYLDNTPVQNNDGSFNFSGYTLEQRIGLPDQDPMPGFSQQETGVEVGADVTFNTPIVRTITDPVVDVARVTLGISALFEQDTKNGDLKPSSVEIAIDYQSNGGGFTQVVRDVIQGKTNSPYQRSYDVRLIGEAPHTIRMRRITPDSDLASVKNETRWETLFEIVEAKMIYPDSALFGITVDAKQFGSTAAERSYDVYGLVIDVPTNYDPVTRQYTGIWDGTFKRAVCNNPAWVLRDIIQHKRYGLGKRVPISSVDKYGLYAVAQYCDQLIPDGVGGMQPRYTINTVVNSHVSAYNLLTSIASAFRGFIYWGSNSVVVSQDRPEDPSMLVTPANVIDGRLSYQTNVDKQKLRSVAIVYWNDPNDNYRLTPEIVENEALVRRIGWEPGQSVVRFGCTNRAEAHYAAKWILEDQDNANKSVRYDAIDDHGFVRPGTIIAVADPKFTAGRRGGRVKAADANSLTVDFPITLAGQAYHLRAMLPDGTVSRRPVTNGPGATSTLTLGGTAWTTPPGVGSVWSLDSDTVVNRQFRVRTIGADEPPFPVTATLFDPTSFARVEQGADLAPSNFLEIITGPLEVPTDLAVIEFLLNDGNSAVPAVQFSWKSATDPRIMLYQARFQRPGGEWEAAEDGSALSRIVRNAEPGTWNFMVRAVDALGNKTAWATGSVVLDGQVDALPNVTGVNVITDINAATATLVWTKPVDQRPLRFELMYNIVNNYAEAGSLGLVDTESYILSKPGYYWIRTRFMDVVSIAPPGYAVANAQLPGYTLSVDIATAALTADINGHVIDSGNPGGTVILGRTELRTPLGVAAAIAGQGALATANTVAWGTQVVGTGRPADNADVTSANTSANTAAVGNRTAAQVLQDIESASTAANTAEDVANQAASFSNDVADNNKFSSDEKKRYLVMVSEWQNTVPLLVARGHSFGLTTEANALTAAWSDGGGFYPYLVSVQYSNLGSSTAIDRGTFQGKANAFQTALTNLSNALDGKAATLSTWAGTTGPGRPTDNADVTGANTAAGIIGQTAWATYNVPIAAISRPGMNLMPYPRGARDRTPAQLGWQNTATGGWDTLISGISTNVGGGYYQISRQSGGPVGILYPFFDVTINSEAGALVSVSLEGYATNGAFTPYFECISAAGVFLGVAATLVHNPTVDRYESTAAIPSGTTIIRVVCRGEFAASAGYQAVVWWAIKVEIGPRATPYVDTDNQILGADRVRYATGADLNQLRPGEFGANVTEGRTAAAIAGQGRFATRNQIGYGDPDLTGLGSLAARHNIRLGYEGGLVNEAQNTWMGDLALITSMGTASSFAGQGALATRDFVGALQIPRGDLLNVIPDSGMVDAGWWGGTGLVGFEAADSEYWTFPRNVVFPANTSFDAYSQFFDLEVGSTYELRFRVWCADNAGTQMLGGFQPLIHMPYVAWYSMMTGGNVNPGQMDVANGAIVAKGDTYDIIRTFKCVNQRMRQIQFRWICNATGTRFLWQGAIRKLAGLNTAVGRLPGQRALPPINAANLSSRFTGTISYSASAGSPATATISVTPGTLVMGGADNVYYGSMAVGVSGTNGTNTDFYLYVDDAVFDGGSRTLIATTDPNGLFGSPDRVFIGSVLVAFPASGTSTGDGDGGGGFNCVDADAWVLTQKFGLTQARYVLGGDWIWGLRRDRTGGEWIQVTGNRVVSAPGWHLESSSGATLKVSHTTPLELEDGSAAYPHDLDGRPLPVEDAAGFRWEPVEATDLGRSIEVAHIGCGGRVYAAGEVPSALIFTHNINIPK